MTASSGINYGVVTIKTIFRSGATSIFQTLFLIIMAVVLMALDEGSVSFHHWRDRSEWLVLPVQELASAPMRLGRWAGVSVSSQQKLIEDNATLRAEQLLLQSKLHQMMLLQRENDQLKELLRSTGRVHGKVKVAQLLSIDLDPQLHQVILNKGTDAGMSVGQPVLDAHGIMGQVVGLDKYTSKVLLISDQHFAIPVLDQRSGIRAVATGVGNGHQLQLINMLSSHDIKIGDLFVSSGFGLSFPEGYPVGTVTAIDNIPGSHEMLIILDIAARLDQSQQVLVAWLDHVAMRKMVQAKVTAGGAS